MGFAHRNHGACLRACVRVWEYDVSLSARARARVCVCVYDNVAALPFQILDMSAGPVAFGSTGTDEGIVDTDTWKESSSSSGPLLFARAARTISAGIQSLLTPDVLVPHIPLLDTRGDLDWRSAVSQVFHRPRVVIIDVMVLSDHSLSEVRIHWSYEASFVVLECASG